MFHDSTRKRSGDSLITQKKQRPSKSLAAKVIIQAFIDYHDAKKLLFKKKITWQRVKNLKFKHLSDYEVETIMNGKAAHEWLTQPPLEMEFEWPRFTLAECMDIVGWQERDIKTLLKPEAWRRYLAEFGRLAA